MILLVVAAYADYTCPQIIFIISLRTVVVKFSVVYLVLLLL